ncbi:nucleolar complex-associated protein-domain-containing protein [Radiomyces spectabilis]|uniref:nucleolar complex-associated protein-domain-containing protein n=1 Tax=Radiomyces spectabilis TaxID=64574 RepID=UPI00221ED5FF|nr:nucleolar complex-associated protein-domain-containing protein [Radiomyces spectabilis]KAI8377706.1 nucleolar complex-associated protein-domain-containing protein [Radiomyces spectabilis]
MPPKRSIQKVSTKTKTPTKAKGKPKPTSDVKNKASKKGKEKGAIPEFVSVPEVDNDDLAISDDDLEFFADNQDFKQFLTSMDPKELSRNTQKTKKKSQKSSGPALIPEPEALSSSEDELDDEIDNDLDLDNDSDLDDLEDMDDELEAMHEAGPVKKKKPVEESDEEMDYERIPRKVASEWTRKDHFNKLPIKLSGGKLVQLDETPKEDESEDEANVETEEVTEAAGASDAEEEEEEQEPAPKLSKKAHVLSMKEELATIASNIQEDPEANIGQLKSLRNIFKDEDRTVQKLALLTQLAVYKDVIPGYRIRPLTEKEEGVQVSKDVKKLREYEKTLLRNYELYLQDLGSLLTKKKTEEDAAMGLVATRCLCELLTSKTHFNFRLEIMVAIVARMSTVQWNEMADMCCKAIITVMENDESGRTSLDAVKMLTRMIKSKGYVVHENVVNTFLHLRLKDEMVPVAYQEADTVGKKRKKQEKHFLTKKARKALKETREIEKEFQEAEAVVSKEEKDKNHTETLKLIFTFYFRVLKKQSSSPLLPAVLEGLARFAHLINIDFFDDLLNALKEVMHTMEDTSEATRGGGGTRKRLLCIITAFQLLSGQGEAINYDLKDFYTEIYVILFKSAFRTKLEDKKDANIASESELLLKGLEQMFLRKRQIPIDRLAAFVKRFCLVALNMPSKSVQQCLSFVHKLVQKDRRLDALLQSEDRAASGIYLPLLKDPELCNPFGTSLYELFLLQNHYDPTVRRLAQTIQQSSLSS